MRKGAIPMADYYLICEDVFSNNSALSVVDRNHYFEDIDAPFMSLSEPIRAFEEVHPSDTRDFHIAGEIFCTNAIARLFAKYHPYRCHFFPCTVGESTDYYLLSLNHILASADMSKSEIIENPFYPGQNKVKVMDLFLDIERINSFPSYLRQMFIVKEAHDRIIVSKQLAEALLEYVAENPHSSLKIKPISLNGQVPEPY